MRTAWSRVLGIALVAACAHSDAFTTADMEHDGPFNPATPIRLTYAPLGDHDPAFSGDGTWITYVFERHGADRDRCVAVLPAAGGTRRHELCARYVGEVDSADGLGAAALRTDGTIAFTLHTGVRGNLTSRTMGLYLGQVDSIAGARRILPLGTTPPGGSAAWSEVVDPIWVTDTELLVLAARRHLVNASDCSLCVPPRDRDRTPIRDTIPVGVEIARLRVVDGRADVVTTVPAVDAIAMSLDRQQGLVHYLVQRPRPDLAEVFHESLADSVYAVPVGGGTPVLRYGTSGLDAAPLERLHGIASGHGRLFISRSWRGSLPPGPTVPPGTLLLSDISEVMPDGSLRTIATAISWRWGRIRLSPDGRHLVAEAVERTTSDIYLLDLPT